ncbi:LON peptidase N-terminal domain and RING finger protein 1 isoform X2 [Bombina bombina]|uniref:LON peptidase N-terminal domain and RING finger protein 1 isoform X2 n=1 Tax=Bombina bombina TaxID=8345 RepID=UPI00235AB3F3|nr:LON peptidase N-terminal domain and RING finger protein 1 isoform X2 [Bombina bombina]
MDLFLCPSSEHLLWDPVTLHCGHSFCKICLQRPMAERCKVCKQRLQVKDAKDFRCNTLLSNLLDKCLETKTKMKLITRDLEDLMSHQEYEEALKLTCKGIVIAPNDVTLRILRSEIYCALKQYPEALREAEVICTVQPRNPVGFYRKGKALMQMKEKKEAVVYFQQCLEVDQQFFAARIEIEQLLQEFGCHVPSSLEDLLAGVSHFLKLSSLDTSILIDPLKTTSIKSQDTGAKMKCVADQKETPNVLPVPDVKKTTTSNQEQRKRKEPEDPCAPDKESLNSEVQEDNMKCSPSTVLLKNLISISDIECSLCIRMLLEPVTTPCGHTFCRECLERCMDHQPYCPLCKQSLREYLRAGYYPITAVVEEIMSAIFPSEMAERKQTHVSEIAELSNLVSNVPIFVCTMAFPGVPCPLHVFEPRYRLMMRRCLETGTKSFGMCLYESGKSFSDYGCILEILHLDYLPDGRSLIETIGRRRFRVLQRGQLDGYHTAEVEYLVDKRMEGEELQEVKRLHDTVYQQLEMCFSGQRSSISRRIFMHHTSLPPKEDDIQASPDGPSWCWWILSILPLDPSYQLLIFSLTSLKERLLQLQHILTVFLQSRS